MLRRSSDVRKRTAAGLALLLGGCDAITLPDAPPFRVGSVIEVIEEVRAGGLPGLWVKEDPAEECGYLVVVTSDVELAVRTQSGGLDRISLRDFRAGQSVRVWLTGNIVDTCPALAEALAIEVLPAEIAA